MYKLANTHLMPGRIDQENLNILLFKGGPQMPVEISISVYFRYFTEDISMQNLRTG